MTTQSHAGCGRGIPDKSTAPPLGVHALVGARARPHARQLIEAYRAEAAPDGQVAVATPDQDGDLFPWCIESFDGAGVTFNDLLFP